MILGVSAVTLLELPFAGSESGYFLLRREAGTFGGVPEIGGVLHDVAGITPTTGRTDARRLCIRSEHIAASFNWPAPTL